MFGVFVSLWVCGTFFFFKQKTAYDMRISDWSSDVCSSDLVADHVAGLRPSIHFDTCTSAGAGACRSLWDDSRTIVDCVVAIGSPVRRLAFAGLMRARDVYLLAINS